MFPLSSKKPLLLLAFLGAVAFLLWPMFDRARHNARRSSCQSNLKQIGLGFMQYARDYDEKWPPVAMTLFTYSTRHGGFVAGGFGWAQGLQPYVKSLERFQCPSETTPPNPDPKSRGYTDYFYNARMARRIAVSDFHPVTILVVEGASLDARAATRALPQSWRLNKESPAFRHLGGANYLMADGRVRWLKPAQVRAEKASALPYQFKTGVGEIWGPSGEHATFDPR